MNPYDAPKATSQQRRRRARRFSIGPCPSRASLLWALAAGEPRVLVRALFDVIFGVGLLRSRESSRTWAMIRAGIWLVYSFQGLSHGKVEALVDIALAALFLLSMLGLLVGAPSRSRVVGAIAAFGLYAFVTLAFVALVALGHLLGA
jgi:hypothetical protein